MQRWFKFQESFLKGLATHDDVYANAYYIRIRESLTEDFPTLKENFNEDEWHSFIHEFTSTFPSDCWTLAEVSDRFVRYLKKKSNISSEWIAQARRDLALCKSHLLSRPDASFDLERLPQSILLLNPTLIPTGNDHEWVRETLRGTQTIVLTPEYSGLLEALLRISPLTVDAILEQLPQFSVPGLEKFFHDWVKDEIFIGTQLLKENL